MNKKLVKSFCAIFILIVCLQACSKKDIIDDKPLQCAQASAPVNGASVNTATVILSWSSVAGATGYDLYIGTTANTIKLETANITGNSYLFTLPSVATATYYWYVVPKKNNESAKGCDKSPVSFTYTATPPPPLGFIVAGYFPSYRNPNDCPDRMFKMCNIINYAFATLTASATIDVASPSVFSAVAAKAKANGAKVFLSINGSQPNFLLLSDAAKRKNLVKNIMAKTRELSLNGIDMDYEYPRTTDGTDTIFTLLMKELSDSLHQGGKYYLSAAITPGRYAGSIRDGISNEVFNYIDFFNVMIYDDFSTSVPYKHHSDMALVNYCMNYWLNTRKMPPQKFVAGIPVYGRNSGSTQIATSYKTILANGVQLGPSPIYLSDSATLTKTDATTYTTYYNGQTSAKQKGALAKTNAGGIMFWEMGQDATDDYSIIKAVCDTIGRTYN